MCERYCLGYATCTPCGTLYAFCISGPLAFLGIVFHGTESRMIVRKHPRYRVTHLSTRTSVSRVR